jgi:hypothetical protein
MAPLLKPRLRLRAAKCFGRGSCPVRCAAGCTLNCNAPPASRWRRTCNSSSMPSQRQALSCSRCQDLGELPEIPQPARQRVHPRTGAERLAICCMA